MKVRRLTLAAGPDGVEPVGSVCEVSRAVAEAMVSGGFAEYVDSPTPQSDTKPQTATRKASETATKPRKRATSRKRRVKSESD